MTIKEVRVDEVVKGDVWIGNDNVAIDQIDHEGGFVVDVPRDYRASSRETTDTIALRLIRLHGRIVSGDDQGTEGWWSLRPDQIIEVSRG